MLDQIDEFLEHGTQDSKDLASILSALRGPDEDTQRGKMTTTMPLRAIAFPKTFLRAKSCASFPYMDITGRSGWRMEDPSEFKRPGPDAINNHFVDHIHQAADAIDAKDEEGRK
jgi:hypothetical protein